MNQSSDAAEQIVRMSLEGVQVAARVSGTGAKEIAALLYTLVKNIDQTSGKTTLKKMLKSGKELKVFSLRQEDFKKFTEEAKRYGVLYCALIKKRDKNKDGIIDIMVKVDDSQKIQRIVKRFKLSEYREADIRTEIEKSIQEREGKGAEEKTNPPLAKTDKENLSSPLLENEKIFSEDSKKPSIRKLIQRIKDEIVLSKLDEKEKESLAKGKEVLTMDLTKKKITSVKRTKNGLVRKTRKFNKKTKER